MFCKLPNKQLYSRSICMEVKANIKNWVKQAGLRRGLEGGRGVLKN